MSAGRICNRSVVIASPEESVREGARRMATKNVGSLVVLDGDGRPTGILTDRDIAIRCVAGDLDPDGTSVGDVMTSPVETVHVSDSIEDALGLMAASGTRRLPVVDTEHQLVGILSLDDVLELLIEETGTIGHLLQRHQPALPT